MGYTQKILIVDLTKNTVEEKILEEDFLRLYPGGQTLGAKLMYDMMPKGTSWDAPESVIAFMAGVMNGTGAFMSCRYTVVSKSPVYNGYNDANAGGNFGPTLRKAGVMGVVVKGKASTPVYIYVHDGTAEIKSAEKYWGKTTTLEFEKQVEEDLNNEYKKEIPFKICAASCGRAGENKSFMAAVMNDGHRAAGRGGSGAVMGAKNLKAIVASGNAQVEVTNKDEILAINKEIIDWQQNGPVKPVVYGFSNWGTGVSYESAAMVGDLGIKNWHGSHKDISEQDLANASAGEMDKTMKKKKFACNACPVGCGAIYEIHEKELDTDDAGRPEYETAGSFGSNLLCGDAYTVNYCNHMCNEYGLDTISAGGTIAWAMDCYEAGLLKKEDLDGIELTWGNAEAIQAIMKKMALCEGVGKILVNGSVFAANYFGVGQEQRNDAGGIELPQHDPRYIPGLARTYKFDPAPGRHVKGGVGPTIGDREDEYKYNPDAFKDDDVFGTQLCEFKTMCGFCEFSGFGFKPEMVLNLFNIATGFKFDEKDFKKMGLRSFMLRQGFNLREGLKRKDTFIAPRFLGDPDMEGPLKDKTYDVEKMGDNFYEGIGCNKEGVPYKATLEEIGGLECLINDTIFA